MIAHDSRGRSVTLARNNDGRVILLISNINNACLDVRRVLGYPRPESNQLLIQYIILLIKYLTPADTMGAMAKIRN